MFFQTHHPQSRSNVFQQTAREWFLVPLPAIEEVIEKLVAGTIERFRYDPGTAHIVETWA
jgi:hypothetical protein